MGWFEDHKLRKQAEEDAAALARWQTEHDELQGLAGLARSPQGFTDGLEDVPIILKPGEAVFALISPSMLVESRRGPGHYAGGSQGFSFRVAKGIHYRIGANRGTFVQGEEQLAVIDTGTVTVTSRRIVFQGAKQSREWAFAKVLGIQHDPALPLTMISVSNRQKVSGFTYDEQHAPTVRFRVSMAVAVANGTTGELAADLDRQLAELDAARPGGAAAPTLPAGAAVQPAPAVPVGAAPPSPSTAASVPAAWYPDPWDPATLRWWDGEQWTAAVHTP
jgi:hypothetical protein